MRCQKWEKCRSVGNRSLRKMCNPFTLFERNWSCSTVFHCTPWHPNTRRQVVAPRLRTRDLKELWWVRRPLLAQKILSWWLNSTLYFGPRGIASSSFSDVCRFFLGYLRAVYGQSLYSLVVYESMEGMELVNFTVLSWYPGLEKGGGEET